MFDVKVFGQSHSEAIGCVIDGLPAGFAIDFEALNDFLQRRAPGKNSYSTKRLEPDLPEFVSGLVDGKTCGAPVCAIIRNTNTKSGDYDNLRDIPRPSHSDYTAYVKYHGANDIRGGGQFSGRLTAPYCIAGGIAMQILLKKGIQISSHIARIHGICDGGFPCDTSKKDFPVFDDEKGRLMIEEIEKARMNLDSVGGVIECFITGVPAGFGDRLEGRISSEVFGIPGIKGIEFGSGFAGSDMTGSQNNDPFYYDGDVVKTQTNNHGGILGGIASGMPIIFRVAVKPTPSIGMAQKSVSLSMHKNTELTISGRHDPCIVPRAVPVIEAAAAVSILKAMEDM